MKNAEDRPEPKTPAGLCGSTRAETANGARGIRTPETRRSTGFQDRRTVPQGMQHQDDAAPIAPMVPTTGPNGAADTRERPDATTSESDVLERLIQSWPSLPRAIRAGIIAMVDATVSHRDESPGE